MLVLGMAPLETQPPWHEKRHRTRAHPPPAPNSVHHLGHSGLAEDPDVCSPSCLWWCRNGKKISNELADFPKTSVELLHIFRPRSHHVRQKKHSGESGFRLWESNTYIPEAAARPRGLSFILSLMAPPALSPSSALLPATTVTSLLFRRHTGHIPPVVSFKISFLALKTLYLLSQVLKGQDLIQGILPNKVSSLLKEDWAAWNALSHWTMRKLRAPLLWCSRLETTSPSLSSLFHPLPSLPSFSWLPFLLLLLPLFLIPGSPPLAPVPLCTTRSQNYQGWDARPFFPTNCGSNSNNQITSLLNHAPRAHEYVLDDDRHEFIH